MIDFRRLSRRNVLFGGGAVLAAAASGSAWAARQQADPLLRAAEDVGPAVSRARLTAIGRAGDRLVAAGAGGVIIVSDDAGATWRQRPVPVSCDLTALCFASPKRGWVVGHDGVVLQTQDAGEHWTKMLDGNGIAAAMKSRYSQAGTSPSLGAEFLAEVDRIVEEGADKPLMDVRFISGLEGFAVGAFNLALRTADGGTTWQPIIERTDNPKNLHLYALAQAQGALFLGGEQGLLRRWNPQSEAFTPVRSPSSGSFFGLLGTTRSLFVFGLQGRVFRSGDGGESWKALESLGVAAVTSAFALSDGRAVFAAQNGRVVITADEGEHWTTLRRVRSTPCFGVAQAAADAVALVGPAGVEIVRLS